MSGETDLRKLLAKMQPELLRGEFVFCSVSQARLAQLDFFPLGLFREKEGITLIVERSIADDEDLDYTFVARMITLTIHSSLEAVGFLAAITSKFARAGISVNTISAMYHDHLFVSTDKAEDAMTLLMELSHDSVGGSSDT